jgi:hypothetical protein
MNRASKAVTGLILSFALTTVFVHATTIDFFSLHAAEATNALTASTSAPPIPASSVPNVPSDPSAVSATFQGVAPGDELTYFTASDGVMKLINPAPLSGLESAATFSPEESFVNVIAGLGTGGPQRAGTQTVPQSGPVPEPSPAVMTGCALLILMWSRRKRRSHLRIGSVLC